MTIETCTCGLKCTTAALSGRTPQSKRRSHKAANANRALEGDRLRIVVRMAERHRHCARRDQRAEDPLHPFALAEAARAIGEPVCGARAAGTARTPPCRRRAG